MNSFKLVLSAIMIDWVSIVRHSRRRFSNYVGTRAPIRMKKRRRAPPIQAASATTAQVPPVISSPHDDRHHYTCCCSHVSYCPCPVRITFCITFCFRFLIICRPLFDDSVPRYEC